MGRNKNRQKLCLDCKWNFSGKRIFMQGKVIQGSWSSLGAQSLPATLAGQPLFSSSHQLHWRPWSLHCPWAAECVFHRGKYRCWHRSMDFGQWRPPFQSGGREGALLQLWYAQGCPVDGVGRQLCFSPAGAHVLQSFWAAATAPRRWLQWPGLPGTPTVIDLMGKGMFNCHHPFMPASPYGRGELEIWLYASHGRYHLPFHCLMVGYGWSEAAVFQCRVPGVPGHRISGRPELKNGGRKTLPQHAPVSIVNLLLTINVFLDSHLRERWGWKRTSQKSRLSAHCTQWGVLLDPSAS